MALRGPARGARVALAAGALGICAAVALVLYPRQQPLALLGNDEALARMLATAKSASTKIASATSGGRPESPLDSLASFLLSQSMGAPAKDMLEATGADRVARVAANSVSSATLERLRALSSSQTHGPSMPAKLLSTVA